MYETEIRIDFLSDWHIGSGLGQGPVADSILNRDINGLPFIPGRAVKGALREGAWRLGMCRKDLEACVNYFWGTASTEKASNSPGRTSVGSGRLPEDISDWLLSLDMASRGQYVGDMTILRAQTALGSNKMVVPHSLRTMECGIPGIFFTCRVAIDAPQDSAWLADYLAAVCAAVKSMGADRARGLGNCRIYPLNPGQVHKAGRVALPAPLNSLQLAEVEQ